MREVLARQMPDRFLVAFSFAGEERTFIESLAIALEAQLGHGTVFYDAWYESYLAGWNADLRLQDIYEKKTALIVVGVSGSYGSKVWTQTEFGAVRALMMRLSASSETKDAMRVLPLRVGDGDVEGILLNTISPDVRDRGVEKTVELILSRLRLACPNAGKFPLRIARCWRAWLAFRPAIMKALRVCWLRAVSVGKGANLWGRN